MRRGRRLVHGRLQRDADRHATLVGITIEPHSGGRHDAFTHAYVSARLTLRLGARIALWLGELNELLGSVAAGKHLEAEMDRHNNAVGRSIGSGQRGGDASKVETARLVRGALERGELRVIVDGRLAPDGETPDPPASSPD